MNKLYIFFFSFILLFGISVNAQINISGTVYDISKKNLVEGVRVINSDGKIITTDSLGRYSINVQLNDTISFFYRGKPTQPFPVNKISNPAQFDISLHTVVESRYKVLADIKVYSKSYKEDSMENRETYKGIFSYRKPGFQTTMSPSGVAGVDLDEIINIFRFRRNKNLRAFQNRLENQEQEKYIDHRFSKTTVSRVTGLVSPQLDSFMIIYRPSYYFTQQSNDAVFYQYILNCSYAFKKERTWDEQK